MRRKREKKRGRKRRSQRGRPKSPAPCLPGGRSVPSDRPSHGRRACATPERSRVTSQTALEAYLRAKATGQNARRRRRSIPAVRLRGPGLQGRPRPLIRRTSPLCFSGSSKIISRNASDNAPLRSRRTPAPRSSPLTRSLPVPPLLPGRRPQSQLRVPNIRGNPSSSPTRLTPEPKSHPQQTTLPPAADLAPSPVPSPQNLTPPNQPGKGSGVSPDVWRVG